MSINQQQFFDDFKKFIADNGIIGTTSGVVIGLATQNLILSIVSDIVFPLVLTICLYLNLKWMSAILPSSGKAGFNISNFLKIFVTWIIVLIITFYFIRSTFQSFLGVSMPKQKSG